MAPYQHPLVDQVPNTQGLHLAVAGSYHMFKFLPVLGQIICDYLRGTRKGVSQKWTWDRSQEQVSVHAEIIPKASC
jgi:sarcosine oxidase/L-pipecolate oxidase